MSVKQEILELEAAVHLGKLSEEFGDGNLSGECVLNADETHFVIDVIDVCLLAMKDDALVKFAHVLREDYGITMMVMLGGCVCTHSEVSMIVFQNTPLSYTVRKLSNDVPGAYYKTGLQG